DVDPVVVVNAPDWMVVLVHDDGRGHELVGHVRRIARRYGLFGRAPVHAVSFHEGGIGLGHAVPSLVSVHGVVAPHHGGDRPDAQLAHPRLDRFDVAEAIPPRHVPAVHARVPDY